LKKSETANPITLNSSDSLRRVKLFLALVVIEVDEPDSSQFDSLRCVKLSLALVDVYV
jgi:hypothetical protein